MWLSTPFRVVESGDERYRIALVLFLTFHMAMNLVAIISAEGYNMVCEFLGANWYALAASW